MQEEEEETMESSSVNNASSIRPDCTCTTVGVARPTDVCMYDQLAKSCKNDFHQNDAVCNRIVIEEPINLCGCSYVCICRTVYI